MNTDKLITSESLAASLKMAAEGMKKKPGLMKSAVPHVKVGDKTLIRKEAIFTKSSQITMQATQKPKFKQREETK